MIKRFFDIIFSFLGLIITFPLILVISFLIKRDDPGPVFYRGRRVGRNGKEFKIFKFRTMVQNADKIGGPSTAGDDPRLTKIGKLLRKYNLDELPQLINVLKGEMSIVGPRPEVPQEVKTFDEETRRIILSVRPGMTDLATLENVHEEEILKGSKDPHATYQKLIKPKKLKLAVKYVKTKSFFLDIKIILETIKIAIF
jgi:lipopolysaccharide/colanic/teichoic acid biosynthesis glycosyltransferase